MKAALLNGYGDTTQFSFDEAPMPKPGPGEALVKVAATSVNPIDWKFRRGYLKAFVPLTFPAILGRDLAGEITALGEGVATRKVGDRVLGLANHTYAEYVVCKAADLALLPAGLEAQKAAALPLVTLTGAQLIESGVRPREGQRVLITGAVGAAGRSAVQVAKKHGAHVIAGVRRSQREAAKALGADEILALDDGAEVAALGEVDAIADTVGGDVILSLLPRLRAAGVLASVVGKPEKADVSQIRFEQVMTHPDAARLAQLAADVAQGKLVIPIRKTFPLRDIALAHKAAEEGGLGKIVITV